MISALREQVAERMGVPPEELEAPQACCTCIRDRDPRRLAAYDEAQSQGCSIAVEGHTACMFSAERRHLSSDASDATSPHERGGVRFAT